MDAVLDAAGKGGLEEAIELARGNRRVMTLADERAAQLGVAMSIPTPDRAPGALDQVMALLASGALRLRHNRHLPIETASKAHELLEGGDTHEKLVLTTDAYRSQAALGSATSSARKRERVREHNPRRLVQVNRHDEHTAHPRIHRRLGEA